MFSKILSYKNKDNSVVSHKQSLLIDFIVVTAMFSVLYTVVSILLSFKVGIVAMATDFFLYLLILLLYFKHKISYRLTSNLYVANGYFVAIFNCTWFSGGDISPVLPWFVLVPVMSLLLLGKSKDTYTWFGLALLAIIIICLSGILGYTFPLAYDHDLLKPFTFICVFGLAAIIYIITMVFESEKQTAYLSVQKKNEAILDSIAYAKRIQSAILPPSKLVLKYLQESFILYKPKDIVAGDFYWLEHVANKVLFAAADCTGHGVPGAMVSVICNNGLNRSVREYGLTEPGEILDKTREIVIAEFEKSEEDVADGMDIALCLLEGNKLKYAGANNPLWVIRNEKMIEIKADKQPIGKFENLKPYTTHTFETQKGDAIYIFSDGYADQFGGENDKKYKVSRLKEFLISIQQYPIEEQRKLLDQEFEKWRGDTEQVDDVCIIGVKV